MLYGSVMPFLEFLPWGIILCPAYLLVSWKCLQATPIGFLFPCPCLFCPGQTSLQHGIRRPVFIYTGYPRCSFHSCKTHHPFLSMVINCEANNMYTTKIKPFSLTFQHLTNPSLVVLISLFPSRDVYHLSRDIKGECPAFPLSIACFLWRSCLDTTIPSKDSLNQSV